MSRRFYNPYGYVYKPEPIGVGIGYGLEQALLAEARAYNPGSGFVYPGVNGYSGYSDIIIPGNDYENCVQVPDVFGNGPGIRCQHPNNPYCFDYFVENSSFGTSVCYSPDYIGPYY